MAKKTGTFTPASVVSDVGHSHEELESKLVALEAEVAELKKQVEVLSSKKTVDVDVTVDGVDLNAKVEKILNALRAFPKFSNYLK